MDFVQSQKPELEVLVVTIPDLGAAPDKQADHPDPAGQALATAAVVEANESIPSANPVSVRLAGGDQLAVVMGAAFTRQRLAHLTIESSLDLLEWRDLAMPDLVPDENGKVRVDVPLSGNQELFLRVNIALLPP